MTHFDPNGADGAAVVAAGTTLADIVVSGAGAAVYEADYGFDRGNEMGVKLTAPGTADAIQLRMTDAAAAWGAARCYFRMPAAHAGGDQIFCQVRAGTLGSNTLCGRLHISTGGIIRVQNRLGATLATLNTATFGPDPDDIYQARLYCNPGTSTTGQILAEVYDDNDNLLTAMSLITNADLGTAQPTIGVFGDPTTATVSGVEIGMSQLTFVTGASQPSISHIAKNVPPPVISGNYPRVLVGGVWT